MRRYRTVILLVLLGVIPLIVAIVAARFFFALEPEPAPPVAQEQDPPPPVVQEPEPPKILKVVAATRVLPVGTLLVVEDLVELEMTLETSRRGYIEVDGPASWPLGYVVREALVAGAPLTRAAVVGPRQRGFLAAVLKPGTAAFTIELDPGTSHAGMIEPGDRVDVILTAELPSAGGGKRLPAETPSAGGEKRLVSRMILEDVRVVAVDRRVEGEERSKDDGFVTATLEVLPSQADRLALGKEAGQLSLAVRSLAAGPAGQRRGAVMDLSQLLPPPLDAEECPPVDAEELRKVVRVIRGDEPTEETFPTTVDGRTAMPLRPCAGSNSKEGRNEPQ